MNATKAAPDTSVFPSPEFMQALAEKVRRQSDLKEDIKKTTHLLQLARQKEKKEELELRGEDPDARIKKVDSSLKQKEREAQRLTHEIQDLFSAEIESFNHQKQDLNISGQIEAPTNAQLHTIESTFKDAISQLIGIFSGDQFGEPETADILERVKRLDAGIVAINNLAKDYGLSANLRINIDKPSKRLCEDNSAVDFGNQSSLSVIAVRCRLSQGQLNRPVRPALEFQSLFYRDFYSGALVAFP